MYLYFYVADMNTERIMVTLPAGCDVLGLHYTPQQIWWVRINSQYIVDIYAHIFHVSIHRHSQACTLSAETVEESNMILKFA